MNEEQKKRMEALKENFVNEYKSSLMKSDEDDSFYIGFGFNCGYEAHMKEAVKIVDGFHVGDKNSQWDKENQKLKDQIKDNTKIINSLIDQTKKAIAKKLKLREKMKELRK